MFTDAVHRFDELIDGLARFAAMFGIVCIGFGVLVTIAIADDERSRTKVRNHSTVAENASMHTSERIANKRNATELNGMSSEKSSRHSIKEHDHLPLSKFQAIGTHNSYHVAPDALVNSVVSTVKPSESGAWEYTHPPLPQQLQSGIRQFELDLYRDPKGGKFAHPTLLSLTKWIPEAEGGGAKQKFDPDGRLNHPGTKVLHVPGVDFHSNVYTLTQALEQILDWSRKHPDHFPIFVLLELKGDNNEWTDAHLRELEDEILRTIPRKRLLTPDDVRGTHENLRTAVTTDGWPSLRKTRGRLILGLDNTDHVRANYLGAHKTIVGRLLFPSCPTSRHPSAAWFKINDPVSRSDLIQRLTKAGFMVRTRADAGGREARVNSTVRRDKAFASGAQWISTDFPVANKQLSDYAVRFDETENPYLRVLRDAANPR
ncbi:Ca2+-dependent phosphoinositide-specific phospholipase C [Rhodopirellula sallentina]|uniref:Uncharacterized protein n=1 Tax=Rhodopirellula sallentina SM41 TaxID=1263870 RepID=M5TRX9_9BACT|nr:Ca2+-dependent phosphoinositide-specific phospholipase C [Rhodopirellula sallentina]EMI51915.1 hypothetical protein RSSM_06647 [Rhodopirellula sallentina SM41]